ncbi:MAG: hypothetical protein ACLPKE_21160, partial [Streptosporangiaceae bacterium]
MTKPYHAALRAKRQSRQTDRPPAPAATPPRDPGDAPATVADRSPPRDPGTAPATVAGAARPGGVRGVAPRA